VCVCVCAFIEANLVDEFKKKIKSMSTNNDTHPLGESSMSPIRRK
jgi:hypothetical protein